MFPDSPSGDAVPVPASLRASMLFLSHKPPSTLPILGCIPPVLPRAPLPLPHCCSAHHAPYGAKPGHLAALGISGSLRGLTCVLLQGTAKISSAAKSKIAVPSIPHLTLAWWDCGQTRVPADKGAVMLTHPGGPKAFSSGSLFLFHWRFSALKAWFSLGEVKIACMNSASLATPKNGQFRAKF